MLCPCAKPSAHVEARANTGAIRWWGGRLLSSSLSGGKKLNRAGKLGVLIKNIVRLGFGRSARVALRAEQDRLHPNLPCSMDVAEAVVSNENRLFRADPQFRQG